MTAGILDIPASQYHADDVGHDKASLSASIAAVLCAKSPLHAWAAHPRLNPDYEPLAEAKFDVGTVAHAMLLQGDDVAVQVDADSWRTNAAKEERDAIRAAGHVPLLTKDWERCRAMVDAARRQIAAFADPIVFNEGGKAEQTLVWTEPNGVTCRSRIDFLTSDYTAILDLKTTGRSANPEQFTRSTLYALGYDVKAAFYIRAVKAVTGVDATFRWVVVEAQPPYALSVISPGPSVLALGAEKAARAIRTWGQCLESGEWPGYPRDVCYAEAPAWELAREEEATWQEREEAA